MEPAQGSKKDAFALLMTAGRRNQQQQQQRKRSSTPSPQQLGKRQHCTPTSGHAQPSQSSAPAVSQHQGQDHEEQQAQQTACSHAQQQIAASPPHPPASQDAGTSAQASRGLEVPPSDGSGRPPTAAAGSDTPAVSKEAAVEAFKRAFSGGSGSTKRPAAQKFDYLLVYDLEATTNKARTLHPIEIIEVSCVIVQTATASITASYQTYVRPTEHPVLDPFCVELCGIQQSQVEAAPLLADALQHHHEWLQQQGVLAEDVSCIPVTWTEWDLKVALCTECRWRNIQRPSYLCRWVDLKRHYKAKYRKAGNLQACVEAAGLTWQGRAHSGIDDACNTANLAIHLMRQGVRFEVTQVSENPLVQQPQPQPPFGSQGRSNSGRVGSGSEASLAGDQGLSPGHQAGSIQAAQQRAVPIKGRLSMAQLAVQKGASGVFDASGRWLGRCFCGQKAKHRTTKRPGPNHGRHFWSCGQWTIVAQQSSSCDFFLWADEVPPGSITGTK